MSAIQASEIGTYLYCKRAWWYRKKGYHPTNQQDLAAGLSIHTGNARKLMYSGCLRFIAYGLFITAIILFAIHLTGLLI